MDVFIVGAGPTGLALACELAWRGVRVRIIDKNRAPSQHSKALGVLPRTLELLENQGVVAEMLQRGVRLRDASIHAAGERIARIDTRSLASHYAFILSLPQSETEKILIARLSSLGVEVEWQTEAVSVEVREGAVEVTLESDEGEPETLQAPWLIGCDGASSFVRQTLPFSFRGEQYEETFNLADVTLEGKLPHTEAHIFLSGEGILLVFPLPGERRFRLIVDEAPGSADENQPEPSVDAFREWLRQRGQTAQVQPGDLVDATWLSRFVIHRRRVSQLRYGRVFLAGDAAHIHSPVGGQGMNRGIQEAINLAWKLALVIQERAPQALLGTYEEERRPVARSTLSFTDWATRLLTSRNSLIQAWRHRVMRWVMNSTTLQSRLIQVAANLDLDYRESPITADYGVSWLKKAAKWVAPRASLAAGDRAPDVTLGTASGEARLYDYLRHPGHTLLLFPDPEADAQDMARVADIAQGVKKGYGADVRSYVVAPSHLMKKVTIDQEWVLHVQEDALYAHYGRDTRLCLIRPDRYIAFLSHTLDGEKLMDYLARLFLIATE